jgi:hypothetical protein
MTTRETLLETALRANSGLRVQAERLIAAYVAPKSDRGSIINELIALFDGPLQREAAALAAEAMGNAETSRPSQGMVDPPGGADLSRVLPLSDDRVRPLENLPPRGSVRRSRGVCPPE